MEERAMVSPELADKIELKKQYSAIVEDYKTVVDVYNKVLSTNDEIECIHRYEGARFHPINRAENILYFNHKDKSIYFENMSDANILKFKTHFLKKYKEIKK